MQIAPPHAYAAIATREARHRRIERLRAACRLSDGLRLYGTLCGMHVVLGDWRPDGTLH